MAWVTVCVSTFGDGKWADLARERAIPSAQAQDVRVVHRHGDSLHCARNAALDVVDTPYAIFLDADDVIEPRYVEWMERFTADVRVPAVRWVPVGRSWLPQTLPRVSGHRHVCEASCLTEGNFVVIGAAARVDLIRKVGGWRDWPMFEDWDLWLRLHLAGASFEWVTQAVYRAYVDHESRNRAPDHDQRMRVHHAIAVANGLPGLGIEWE